ncbi:MAG: 2-hydroxyacid dehydrogenase, partial [Candidatus Nanopelagicales bacterium]
VVQTLTAGYEHLIDHVPGDVALCNARGVHEASTAELAVGLMIASLRGIPDFVRAQDQGRWLHQKREALADKRVLILGYGSVGQAVAERLTPFEVELIPVAHHARQGVHAVTELGALLPSADIVVVTVPLTPETTHLVDREFLAQLANGALLVNVARGQVVDTQALITELGSGRIRAAMDVTDPEPLPPEHPLWSLPNVLISPHVGGNTSAFAPRAWRLVRDQVMRYYADKPLRNVVIEPHC